MHELTIREVTPSDAEALTALYVQFGPHDLRVTPERVAAILGEMRRYPDYRVYVAERRGSAVGTFALMIAEALGSRCRPFALVEDVVVDEAARGEGVGRAMMEFAMRRATAAGCYKLVLSSNVAREAAHRFYEGLGFRKHGFSFVVDLPVAGGS